MNQYQTHTQYLDGALRRNKRAEPEKTSQKGSDFRVVLGPRLPRLVKESGDFDIRV